MSYAFEPQRMSALYRFFVSHKYPPLALVRRAYLPGECEALRLGVPVATDEELREPGDARLMGCYHNLLVERGNTRLAQATMREILAGLTPLDRPLGSARIVAVGMRAGKLDVAIAAAGAEKGELRYQLSRDGKVGAYVGPSLTIPAPAHWKSGAVYVDHVELTPGRWDVEAQLTEPAPQNSVKVDASAPLGTFVR
jgi:hypothetical protein